MKTAKRASAICLAAVICFAMAFSFIYIAHNSDHECSGEDCVICVMLRACSESFGSLGIAFGAVCLIASAYLAGSIIRIRIRALSALSPVTLKVRLIN